MATLSEGNLVLPFWSNMTTSTLSIKTIVFASIFTFVLLAIKYPPGNPRPGEKDFQKVQRAWFGLPVIGHVLTFVCNPDAFLRFNRDRIQHGIFGLKMFGVDTYIIHSPSLMRSFFAQPNSVIEHKTMGAEIITKIFDFPKAEVQPMVRHFDELMDTFVTHLMKGPGLEESWHRLLTDIEKTVPNIITPFDENVGAKQDDLSVTLHNWWESTANIEKSADGSFTASLFPLVRNCVGALSSREMMGSAFMASHPAVLEDVWQIDANIMGFVFGYPSFLPWIAGAKKARAKILEKLVAWHSAMEEAGPIVDTNAVSGPFADVGSLMKVRQKIWSARGFSMEARAGVDLSILWALNANSNSTCYWLLRNIYATPGMVDRVRNEIAPLVVKSREGLSIDWKALLHRTPLFKACYFESLRIDSAPWSFKRLQKDCSVVGDSLTKFKLHQGDAVLVPADLHHTDSQFFQDPEAFIPERFLVEEVDGTTTAQIKTIRPYGGGATMCKGRILAEREVLAFVAGVLVCWDLEPAPGSSWGMDARQRTSGVCKPEEDLRVRLVRRKV